MAPPGVNVPVTVLVPVTVAGEVTVKLVATLLPLFSVNQRLPSGPTAIQAGPLAGSGYGKFGDGAGQADAPDPA